MIEIPPKVAALLDGAVRRVRCIYIARGIAAALAVFLMSSFVVMGIDAWVTVYSDPLRWAMSLGIYVSSLAAFLFASRRSFPGKIDRLKIAKIFDDRHEENEECLTALVGLSLAAEREGRVPASPAFVRLLAAQAEKSAAGIDVKKELTARTVARRLFALGAVALLFAGSFIALPRLAGMLFLRAVAPWADVGNLYSDAIRVTPGDIDALAGGKIVIKAVVEKGFAYEPQIRISRRTALGWGAETAESMSGGVYRATADLGDREWRYRVSAGPAVTKYFFARVHEKPAYKAFSAKVEYPDYTGISPLVVSNEAVTSIRAIEGSRVTFDVVPDHRATKAHLTVAGKESSSWTMVSTNAAGWSLVLENAAGFRSPPRTGTLESVPDMPPSVVIEKPQRSVRVPPHAKVPLAVTALDDTLGLSNELLVRTGGGTWRVLRSLEKFSRAGASLWKGEDELDLSLLDLEGERRLEFAVLVRDACPPETGGPHCVTSAPVVVSLESKAESFALQSLAAEEKKLKAKIDEAKKRLAAAVSPAKSAAARIKREKKVSETADREIAEAAHETREAAKRLEEIREKAGADARLRPLEKKLDEAVEEKTSAVLEKLKAAQFASPEKRSEALEEVPEKLAEALKTVKELEEEFKERMAQLRNHERMEDLARRQVALARSAKTGMRREDGEKPDPRMMEAWKRMQHEAAARAKELAAANNDAQLDEARRRMEKAAALMDREKAVEQEKAKHAKNPQALEKLAEARERREETEKLRAMRRALAAAEKAEQTLREAAKMKMPRPAADAMHRAMNAQRTAQDELEKAGIEKEEERVRQHEAEKAVRAALEAAAQARKAGDSKEEASREKAQAALAKMDEERKKALSHQETARSLMEKSLAEAEKAAAERAAAEKAAAEKAAAQKAAAAAKAAEEKKAAAGKAAAEKAAAQKAAAAGKTPAEKHPQDGKAAAKADPEKRTDERNAVAEKAAQAAESMKERVEKEAKRLGLDSEPGASATERKEESDRFSSGGIAAELKRRMLELKNVEIAGDIKELLLREGWFRIKGSAKDGLGAVDLDAVAPEYRELVRLYFLKLSEETK